MKLGWGSYINGHLRIIRKIYDVMKVIFRSIWESMQRSVEESSLHTHSHISYDYSTSSPFWPTINRNRSDVLMPLGFELFIACIDIMIASHYGTCAWEISLWLLFLLLEKTQASPNKVWWGIILPLESNDVSIFRFFVNKGLSFRTHANENNWMKKRKVKRERKSERERERERKEVRTETGREEKEDVVVCGDADHNSYQQASNAYLMVTSSDRSW